MVFMREPGARALVEDACRAEGLEPAGWRDVPTNVAALGSTALASMPRIGQLLLAPCPHPDAELRAHRARRRAERYGDALYIASLSFRTVTYKALCAATQLAAFYPDLERPEARGAVRDLPPALLDEHGAQLGARAAVPPALSQRRDQHDRGQRRLDGGTRAREGARGRSRARARRLGLGLRPARQRARAARPGGQGRDARR